MSTILGAAGEHYVMCQLLRHGLIAALAPTGVPNADIVVTDTIGERMCAIQVKARRDIGSDGGWHMKAKHETLRSPTLFYAFVDFGQSLTAAPQCWIVPSAVVADVIAKSYSRWLETPGARGQQHQETNLRRFLPDYTAIGYPENWLNPYLEAWDSLRTAANI